MAPTTKVFGKMTKPMARGGLFIPMAMSMRETGSMIRLKDMVSTHIKMEHSIKVIGKQISSMERVKRPGLMVLGMKATMSRARSTARGHLHGRTDLSTEDNSMRTIFRAKAPTTGRMAGATPGLGSTIRCMAKACSLGQMAEGTRANTLKTRNMGTERSFGQTVGSTLESGRMGSNMAKGLLSLSMGSIEREFGTMGRDHGGLMNNNDKVLKQCI